MNGSPCCAPDRDGSTSNTSTPRADQTATTIPSLAGGGIHEICQASIPAGTFAMGDHHGDRNAMDGEVPIHRVRLDGFEIDTTTVTNADFARFVDATGFRTEAEVFGYSAVFHLLVADCDSIMGRPPRTPWWYGVSGADWRHPGGPSTDIGGLDEHPVIHISWNDAMAYCAWAGRRLPTEAEWEYASRGGATDQRFPWGNELMPEGRWRCNIWQGHFPRVNTEDDGYLGTAPVRAFPANAWGVYQTVGNVWEWCSDWFDANAYLDSPEYAPSGPSTGQQRVMRGGSYLCHDSYCNRYRNSARTQNTPDSSAGNVGFRTVSLLGSR